MPEQPMSILEARARLYGFAHAFDTHDLIAMVQHSGLPFEMASEMKFEEVLQAMQVRITDIARIAGVELLHDD